MAPWVSANDKPTVLSKPVVGDAAEQRLKMEVMAMPARDRRRLKEIPEVSRHIHLNKALSRSGGGGFSIDSFGKQNDILICGFSHLDRHHQPSESCSGQLNPRISKRQADQAARFRPRQRRRPEQNEYIPPPQSRVQMRISSTLPLSYSLNPRSSSHSPYVISTSRSTFTFTPT